MKAIPPASPLTFPLLATALSSIAASDIYTDAKECEQSVGDAIGRLEIIAAVLEMPTWLYRTTDLDWGAVTAANVEDARREITAHLRVLYGGYGTVQVVLIPAVPAVGVWGGTPDPLVTISCEC
jgi:hypothetical protein